MAAPLVFNHGLNGYNGFIRKTNELLQKERNPAYGMLLFGL